MSLLALTCERRLKRLIQRHRTFVPAFGALLLQFFVHRRRVDTTDCLYRANMLIRAQHICQPTYFERQDQIQIILRNLTHSSISFALMNVNAFSVGSVWNRYWSTKSYVRNSASRFCLLITPPSYNAKHVYTWSLATGPYTTS